MSETIDGDFITPTELFFHPGGLNIIVPFGTIMYLNVLDILSTSGPYVDSEYPGGYDVYTSTFLTGTWPAFGTIFTGTGPETVDFTVNIQQASVPATPEPPPGLILLATALVAMIAFLRRSRRARYEPGIPLCRRPE